MNVQNEINHLWFFWTLKFHQHKSIIRNQSERKSMKLVWMPFLWETTQKNCLYLKIRGKTLQLYVKNIPTINVNEHNNIILSTIIIFWWVDKSLFILQIYVFIIKEQRSKDINIKSLQMEDGDKQNLEKHISRQHITNMPNVGTFFQSIWFRCGSVFSNIMDRKFMESKLRFVLCCGSFLWFLYLLSKTF